MADPNFHEIQLSGKQLVFLFMTAVVASVCFFLLGVSVGKGVRGTGAASAQAAVVIPDAAPAVTPPNAPATSDLTYPNRLQGPPPGGSTTPVASTPDPAVSAPPAATPPAGTTQPVTPATKPTESKVADSKPAPTKEPKATDPPATPASSAGYSLQTGAFNTRSAADSQVAQLKAKKYPASVVTSPAGTPGPRFHVMVGPYPARADAQKVLSSLQKDGYDNPIIKK